MKALLKRVGGGLVLAPVGIMIAGIAGGFVGGIGTGIAHDIYAGELKKFYENENVQEIADDTLEKELADLDAAYENGDITRREYLEHSQELNKDEHFDELTENAANEYFEEYETFHGLVKKEEQLKVAYTTLFAIFGGSIFLFPFTYCLGFVEKLVDVGGDLIQDAKSDDEIRNLEKKRRKEEKAYEEELQSYSEEVDNE